MTQDVEGADEEACKQLAIIVEGIYTDPDLAPKGFHTKDGVKKDLRQRVRKEAHTLGFKALKDLPVEIEEIALKFYAKSNFDSSCECVTVGLPPCNMIPCLTTAKRAEKEGWGPLE